MDSGHTKRSQRIVIDPWQETEPGHTGPVPVGSWEDRQAASESDEYIFENKTAHAKHAHTSGKEEFEAWRSKVLELSTRFRAGLKKRGLNAEKPVEGRYKARSTVAYWRMRGVQACAVIMALGLAFGLLFFARPSTSTLENRTLSSFPQISTQSFLSGEFFTDLSLWYADTYPLREVMVGSGLAFKQFYGIQSKEAFYGANRQSDELPPIASDSSQNSEGSSSEQAHTYGGVAKRSKDTNPPDMQQAAANLEAQITSGVYMTDTACYTLYYFSQDACEEYCGVINEAAEALDGIANVYSIILPTNAGVMLDADLQKNLGGANQQQAIDYFYSRLSDKVIPVETFEPLYEHKDEYLYFRTDHHWTQLGAYYVYESFCKAKGIQPANYAAWEEKSFDGFLGAYYSEIGVAGMANYADTVVARIPQGTNDMVYWTNDLDPSSEIPGMVISDLSDADKTALYQTFVCGNQPLSKIENPALSDGSSCLIIKDSFGNPLTSVLVDSYQTIYTFDFRYSSQDLVSFVKAHNIQDVIIENCVMFAGTYDAANMVGMIVDGTNAELAGAGPDATSQTQEQHAEEASNTRTLDETASQDTN